jgi:hypothetical protein
MITPAPYTATAETVARHLELVHARLAALRAEAEAARLPQSITMGLHWLCEDAASTLADLHNLAAQRAAA